MSLASLDGGCRPEYALLQVMMLLKECHVPALCSYGQRPVRVRAASVLFDSRRGREATSAAMRLAEPWRIVVGPVQTCGWLPIFCRSARIPWCWARPSGLCEEPWS